MIKRVIVHRPVLLSDRTWQSKTRSMKDPYALTMPSYLKRPCVVAVIVVAGCDDYEGRGMIKRNPTSGKIIRVLEQMIVKVCVKASRMIIPWQRD